MTPESELIERVEEGMTTIADADTIRDILDELAEIEKHLDGCEEAIDG